MERAPARAMLRADRYDRRRLGQGAGRCRVELERSDAVQHAARPAGQAGQAGRARRGRLPDRVRHDRRLRRHLDGPRRHARFVGVARDHRRLGRVHDALRAARRARHVRGLRQEPARHADGRGAAATCRRRSSTAVRSCPVTTRISRSTSSRCSKRSARARPAHITENELGEIETARVPDRRIVRGHVHREHDVVDRGSNGHGARRARLRRPPSTAAATTSRTSRVARSCTCSSSTCGPARS